MRTSDEEARNKKDKFIKAYVGEAGGNAAEAARLAGYAPSRAPKTGYDLIKYDDYVKEQLSSLQHIQKNQSTDSEGTIDDIFDMYSNKALTLLALKSQMDPASASKFLELKLKFDKAKDEEYGDFEGLSTTEIIGMFDSIVQEGQMLKERIMETARKAEMPEQPDLPSEGSLGIGGSEEESVGTSSSGDSSSTEGVSQ